MHQPVVLIEQEPDWPADVALASEFAAVVEAMRDRGCDRDDIWLALASVLAGLEVAEYGHDAPDEVM